MERGLTCVAASQSTSPLCFSSHSFIHKQLLLPVVTTDGKAPIIGRRRKPLAVKALNVGTRRQTLSGNWDVANFSSFATSAPSLPRFEELDTTNMLLRQRIIFLGSQVLFLPLYSYLS